MLAPIMYSMTYFYKIVLKPINKVKSRPNILPTRGANLSRKASHLPNKAEIVFFPHFDLVSLIGMNHFTNPDFTGFIQ